MKPGSGVWEGQNSRRRRLGLQGRQFQNESMPGVGSLLAVGRPHGEASGLWA